MLCTNILLHVICCDPKFFPTRNMSLIIAIPSSIENKVLILHLFHTQSQKGNKVLKLCNRTMQLSEGLHY